MSPKRRLVAIFAHPDDESFSCGATMAMYAAQGADVTLVTATRGEVGEISDPKLATSETLGKIRERELRNACKARGIPAPIFLGYRDSGMRGTKENRDVRSLAQARPSVLVEQLTAILLDLKPQVVITFDPYGGYGHPDHVAVHRAAVAAFGALEQKYPASKLYYGAFPRSVAREFQRRAPPDSAFSKMDPEKLGIPDEPEA